MNMMLTKGDLEAIKSQTEEIVGRLARQTAAGFAEVHGKIDGLEVKIDRIDRTLQAEIMRNDHQDEAINRMRKALHAA